MPGLKLNPKEVSGMLPDYNNMGPNYNFAITAPEERMIERLAEKLHEIPKNGKFTPMERWLAMTKGEPHDRVPSFLGQFPNTNAHALDLFSGALHGSDLMQYPQLALIAAMTWSVHFEDDLYFGTYAHTYAEDQLTRTWTMFPDAAPMEVEHFIRAGHEEEDLQTFIDNMPNPASDGIWWASSWHVKMANKLIGDYYPFVISF